MGLEAEGIGFGGLRLCVECPWDLQPLSVNGQPL